MGFGGGGDLLVTTAAEAEGRLRTVLAHAYSGELAAAFAYDGHAKSVSDATERDEIARIRQDELDHRERVGEMLADLGGQPSRRMEIQFWWIGTFVSLACRVGRWFGGFGWFWAMWGAGKLERGNIVEYERAAAWARDCGRDEWNDELLHMAEVEWDHELYFREKSESHWLARFVWIWPDAGPREAIRARYEAKQFAIAESAGATRS